MLGVPLRKDRLSAAVLWQFWDIYLILARDTFFGLSPRQAAALLQLLRMPAGDGATALRLAIKHGSLKVHAQSMIEGALLIVALTGSQLQT